MSEGTFSHVVAYLFPVRQPLPLSQVHSGRNFLCAFTTLWANLADDIGDIFLSFRKKQDLTFHANCLQLEAICMKCRILFSGIEIICMN